LRRTVTVVIATIGGLALLASFHATSGTARKAVVGVIPSTQPPASGSPPTGGSTTPGSASSTPAPSTARPTSRTIAGPVVSNQYGDVQVELIVAGGRLADVEALQLPFDRRRSQEISNIAGPELRQEALQAKSANINVISGATYTSDSYAQSLQGALDQAGL
jgi:uncharacterized protein with FMN-binding domain